MVRILLVEDNEADAILLQEALKQADVHHPVDVVTDGERALDFLATVEQQPALILLDLNLPDMSGTDILARVKSDDHLKRTPVVVLTTTDDKLEIQRCYDLGANVYITKPVNYDGFANAIRQLGLFFAVMQVPEAE